MKKLIFLLSLLPFLGFSQLPTALQKQVDSLKHIINTSKTDTTIILALDAWNELIYVRDPDLNLLLNQKIDSICSVNLKKNLSEKEELCFLKAKAAAINHFGMLKSDKGDYDVAIELYTEALTINQAIGEKKGIGNCLLNIGASYLNKGDFDKSIEYNMKCLKLREETGNKKGIAGSLCNIGNVYSGQNDHLKAVEYYSKSLEIYEEIGSKEGISILLGNLGNEHSRVKEYDKALEFYNKSLLLKREAGDKLSIAITLGNIGRVYKGLGNYPRALEYQIECFQISESIGHKKGMAISLYSSGYIYANLDEYKKALVDLNKSLSIAQEIGVPATIRSTSRLLWQLNKLIGDSKASLEMYELYIATRDSMDSKANQKAVIQQEYKYKYEKQAATDSIEAAANIQIMDAQLVAEGKQRKLEAKQQALQRYLLYSLLAIALLFGGFIFYRFRETRRQKATLEITKNNELAASNLKALKSQMNPHFIFNSINSIQDLVLKQETLKSYDYLVVFSDLVRKILDFSEREFVPVEEEVNFLHIYLGLEKLRFQDDFNYKITNNFKNKSQLIPSLIVQPFVENAIKHGLLHKEGKKVLEIEFIESDIFKCIIRDNGIGLTASKKIQERQSPDHKSFATKAVKNRLEILSSQMNGHAAYEMIEEVDLEGNVTGTKVAFTWRF